MLLCFRSCLSPPAPPPPAQPRLYTHPIRPPQLPPEDLNEAKFSFSLLCNLIRAVTPVAAYEAGGGSPLQTRLLPECILPLSFPLSLPPPPLLQHARCRAVTSVPGTPACKCVALVFCDHQASAVLCGKNSFVAQHYRPEYILPFTTLVPSCFGV